MTPEALSSAQQESQGCLMLKKAHSLNKKWEAQGKEHRHGTWDIKEKSKSRQKDGQ